VGKTSVSLSIVGAMQQLFKGRVGYCKPVGQESIVVRDGTTAKRVLVDKDVPLFKEALGCVGEWHEMSPVLMRKGFTKEFLDGRVPVRELHERAVNGVMSIRSRCEFQVIEGTKTLWVMYIAALLTTIHCRYRTLWCWVHLRPLQCSRRGASEDAHGPGRERRNREGI